MKEGWRGIAHLFRVVDLPDEGLPTRPMRGSRGIVGQRRQKDRLGIKQGQYRVMVAVGQ